MTLKRYLLNVVGSSPGTTIEPRPGTNFSTSPGAAISVCQRPAKSGLPPVRGAGAVRFGLPSRVRGTPRAGSLIHWPERIAATRRVIARYIAGILARSAQVLRVFLVFETDLVVQLRLVPE